MTKTINDFKQNGYCLVKSAISSELRDFITQYALFDEMQSISIGDSQVPDAHFKYADPAMETMLVHLHKLMEKHTGLELYPTYSYYRVYRLGDDLKPHTDRPSCEISATLCFNYSYDDKKMQWPIFMGDTKIDLNPGDLAIYRGCDITHWRETFNSNDEDWHVQGFFHYVDKNGPYAEYKWDKRGSIGEKMKPDINKPASNIKSYIQYTN